MQTVSPSPTPDFGVPSNETVKAWLDWLDAELRSAAASLAASARAQQARLPQPSQKDKQP